MLCKILIKTESSYMLILFTNISLSVQFRKNVSNVENETFFNLDRAA